MRQNYPSEADLNDDLFKFDGAINCAFEIQKALDLKHGSEGPGEFCAPLHSDVPSVQGDPNELLDSAPRRANDFYSAPPPDTPHFESYALDQPKSD